MSDTYQVLGEKWTQNQDDRVLSCARSGDCIFQEVQKGTSELEASWKKIAPLWNTLIGKAVQGGFLGWGAPLIEPEWLEWVLFQPALWPPGLTPEEIQLLRIAKALEEFSPSYGKGRVEKSGEFPVNLRLAVLRKYAALTKKKIVLPMWGSYLEVTERAGKRIAPLCSTVYGESCDTREAENIFQGDLERGWKLKVLEASPPFYRVFPYFLDWAVT